METTTSVPVHTNNIILIAFYNTVSLRYATAVAGEGADRVLLLYLGTHVVL